MRARISPTLLSLLLGAAILGSAAPTAAQVSLRNQVDTTLVTVGDRIRLTVSVTHPEGASVVWPDSLDLAPFEVLSAELAPVRATEGGAVSTAVLSLTAFELGELEVPSFDLDVLLPDGAREAVSTDRFGIEVVSVGADETGDIREIRGPLAIPVSVVTVALWLIALVFAALAGAWGYRRWARSREAGVVDEPGPPPRPPHEIALEALDRIEGSELLVRGAVKEYHIEVSDVLRRYVEARFRVPALEMTTWEILDGLARVGVGAGFREDMRRFLDQCDLVKFAKVRPDGEASREVLDLGRALVRESMNRSGGSAEPSAAPDPDPAAEAAVATGADATPAADSPPDAEAG